MSERKTGTPRSKNRRMIRRLTLDAMLAAMYFVLACFVSIDLPLAQFSISSLPIILCGFLFGPVDTLAVSLLGSFLEQMLKYGVMVTTPLWMVPAVLLGLFVSLCAWLCRYEPKIWQVITITVIAELLFTTADTVALYVDGMIWHYSPAALTTILPGRLLAAGLRMVVTVPLTVFALRRGGVWGLGAGFVYGCLDFLSGGGFAITWQSIILDYVAAYTLTGLAGFFPSRPVLGALVGGLGRYACLVASGVFIWGEYMSDISFFGLTLEMNRVWVYSLIYNAQYMILTIAVTLICVAVLAKTTPLTKNQWLRPKNS